MHLEDLPNEILLEIFSRLDAARLHRAFHDLNHRFDCLLYDRCLNLHARFDSSSLAVTPADFYPRIGRLALVNCSPEESLAVLRPSALPILTSVCVRSSGNEYFGRPAIQLIKQLLSFSTVRRCDIQLSPTLFFTEDDLPHCSSIQSMHLSMITLDQLLHLLRHLPGLRSLHVWLNWNSLPNSLHELRATDRFESLETLTLVLHNEIEMSEVFLLLRSMPHLRHLAMSGSLWDQAFLDVHHWTDLLMGSALLHPLDRVKADLQIRCISRQRSPQSICRHFRTAFPGSHFVIRFLPSYWFEIHCQQ